MLTETKLRFVRHCDVLFIVLLHPVLTCPCLGFEISTFRTESLCCNDSATASGIHCMATCFPKGILYIYLQIFIISRLVEVVE